jgi:membrane protein
MGVADTAQRTIAGLEERHSLFALVLAVGRKYSADKGGYLAAVVSYYAFLSIFPLLLVFVTLLGYALEGDPDLQRRVLHSALADFPVIGPQIEQNVHSLNGSAFALVIGIAVALWAGTGVCLALEHAFDQIWGVPSKRQSNFVWKRLRALAWLAVLGAVSIIGALPGALSTSSASYGLGVRLLGVVLSFAVSLTVFLMSFRVLTSASPTFRQVLPGALVATVAWEALLTVGGYYVAHQLRHSSSTYGVFALVIVLLGWLYLAASIAVLACELNATLAERRAAHV